jgi:hypothetical protein
MAPCVQISQTWWQWHPPVGVFIAFLALVGVAVPWFRLNASRHEKAFWTVLMFVFVGLEINSIYRDQQQHDNEQEFARCQQLQSFTQIATTLQIAIKNNQEQFDKTISGLNLTISQTQPHAQFGPPQLEFDNLVISPNRASIYNINYKNIGNDTAQKVDIFSKIYVGKPDDIATEDSIHRQFEDDWRNRKVKNSISVSPGGEQFGSFYSTTFSLEDLNNLRAGISTLYAITRTSYVDKSGHWYSDFCQDAQVPFQHPAIFHVCAKYINERYKPRLP